jgi:hypothetical protein
MEDHPISWARLIGLTIILTIVFQANHETGHLIVYQAFGRHPVYGFLGIVQLWERPPLHPDDWVATASPEGAPGWLRMDAPSGSEAEALLEALAGPAASLFSILLGFGLAHYSKRTPAGQTGLVFALAGGIATLLTYLHSPIRSGIAEGWIAAYLGLHNITIELPFAAFCIMSIILGLRQLKNWRSRFKWFSAILLGVMFSGFLMIIGDQIIAAQIDMGNPWFRPYLGFSLPVLIVNILVLFAIWALERDGSRKIGSTAV